jgi:hypothetical protein
VKPRPLVARDIAKMGWTYNTKDPDASTLGPLITGVASALTLLSLITVCLRVYVRAFLIKAFGAGILSLLLYHGTGERLTRAE